MEMLLHLFCVQKNISTQSERLLFDIVQRQYEEEDRPFTSYSEFRKQLATTYDQVPYTDVMCHIKNIKEKNYKPFDPENITRTTTVPVYDVKKQLELYLHDIDLSAAVIRKPTGDGKTFSSFTSGDYFKSLCKSLEDIIPICCKYRLTPCLSNKLFSGTVLGRNRDFFKKEMWSTVAWHRKLFPSCETINTVQDVGSCSSWKRRTCQFASKFNNSSN